MTRAVRIHNYGDRDVLQVEDIELPAPASGQVLVTVRAAGTNPGEAAIRSGFMEQMYPSTFPMGQGSDLAGVVEAVGDGVTTIAVGDEVLGWTNERGSHAEQVLVPAAQLVHKPQELSWEVAGSLFVAGTTARAAIDQVNAKAGDTVVVSAATGGVGSTVTQLLADRGATVLGIASAANADWLRAHGATPVAYGDGLADRVRAAAPQGVDALIDLFGPDYLDLAAELGVDKARTTTVIAFEKAGQVGITPTHGGTAATIEVLTELAQQVAAGKVDVPIAATYPLDQVQDAFAELEQRHARGKIVLVP